MMSEATLRGCGTALVTPFLEDGAIDESAYRALVQWQIAEGVDFLVPCGSTGEAATMDLDEHLRVVSLCVEAAEGRLPIVAGAGSNDTAAAIRLSEAVCSVGATHLLHVSPMYNKPPQRGILAHFLAIADASPRPIVVYNVPGRTGSNIAAATTLELAAHPNIVAVKEASGSLGQIADILHGRLDGFTVLSGDDAVTLPLLALGGDGVISVVSNAVPRQMSDLVRAGLADDMRRARELHMRLLPLMTAAFVETNPIPIKAALAELGRSRDTVRLPLLPLADEHRPRIRAALDQAMGAGSGEERLSAVR